MCIYTANFGDRNIDSLQINHHNMFLAFAPKHREFGKIPINKLFQTHSIPIGIIVYLTAPVKVTVKVTN